MKPTRRLNILLATGALAIVAALLAPGVTSAGFTDSTFARAAMTTAGATDTQHVASDLSAASSLALSAAGELYVSGYRGTGDGNGNRNVPATADPTRVEFPDGVRIVDAGGSTNDYHAEAPGTTAFMALDSNGGVWTWGTPWGGAGLIGRGKISTVEAARAGQVTRTASGEALPPIVAMARSENQFFGLDEGGTMWAWGYGGENLPFSGGPVSQPLPVPVTTTGVKMGNVACDGKGLLRERGAEVSWHSIWSSSNGASAVARNGLVYSWGFTSSTGTPGSLAAITVCPTLNEGANRALFERYPDQYRTAQGETYDPTLLTSEKARSERYRAIVSDMEPKVLPACDGSRATGQVDESACPVRQLGVDTYLYRLLTQDGELLTWTAGNNAVRGDKLLGRVQNSSQSRGVPAPVSGGLRIDRVVAGVSSFAAVTEDGAVYGWGANNACQALGKPSSDRYSCAKPATADTNIVTAPTPIAGLPSDGARPAAIASAACSTWVEYDDGTTYAWGGGTIAANFFDKCYVPLLNKSSVGYKIFITDRATAEHRFGLPITAPATSTTRVR